MVEPTSSYLGDESDNTRILTLRPRFICFSEDKSNKYPIQVGKERAWLDDRGSTLKDQRL